MKYIVYWVIWKSVQVGCPEQWVFDLKWGQGNYDCCVGHFKTIPTEYNAGFNTLKEAKIFYNKEIKEQNKCVFKDQKNNYISIKFNGCVDSVRIDSIKIK
jgi:hypothetical protein